MSETQEQAERRASIAARNRKHVLDERERKLTILVTGLLGYSAFSNLLGGAMALVPSLIDAALGLLLGLLYALGVYRVYFKDDIRWWPITIPAGTSIAILLLAWLGGVLRPIPLLLNIALLILVPLRRRAVSAAADGA